MTPKQRRILVALISKQRGGELPYTILPQGIKCSTGEEFISTGAAWQESCVWEVGGYLQGSGFFEYGYTAATPTCVRNSSADFYQLGVAYNPLGDTDIYTPAVSKFSYTVEDMDTKSIRATLEVQGAQVEISKENIFIYNKGFRLGMQSYGVKTTNMVIQSAKRTVNGVVTHDYVACDYNGQLGMWDRVTDTFIGNSGAGEFVLP